MTDAPQTVNRHVVVDATPADAFHAFTSRFGEFKPKEHNLLGVDIVDTVFEPHVGGNLYDRGADGGERRWARILAYEPPYRVVSSRDIGPTWPLETNPELTSEVEVRFTLEADDRTRVELEYRHLDRHGPGWEGFAFGVDDAEGWPLHLDRYAALLTRVGGVDG